MNEIINGSYQIEEERTLDLIASEIKLIEQHTAQAILAGAVGIGTRLKEAKEKCPHGEWEKWCEEHLQYTARWASQLMRISDEYGDQNSPYFRAISKTNTSSDLSVSNALRLLAVPADEVENFVEEHPDVSDMKVKDLEAEIKDLKERLKREEKNSGEEIESLKKTNESLKENNEILNEEVENLTEKLAEVPTSNAENELKEELAKLKKDYEAALEELEELTEKADSAEKGVDEKLEAAKAEAENELKEKLLKLQQKNQDLKKQLKAAEEDKEMQLKEAEEAKEKEIAAKLEEAKGDYMEAAEAAARAEKEQLEEQMAKLQRELQQNNNAAIAAHKAKLGVMQSTFEDILKNLKDMPDEDRSRLTIGLHKFLSSLDGIIGK